MNLMRLKKKGRAPLSSQAAIAVGGLLLTWGYRRWDRRKAAHAEAGLTPSADVKAEADSLPKPFFRKKSIFFRKLRHEIETKS